MLNHSWYCQMLDALLRYNWFSSAEQQQWHIMCHSNIIPCCCWCLLPRNSVTSKTRWQDWDSWVWSQWFSEDPLVKQLPISKFGSECMLFLKCIADIPACCQWQLTYADCSSHVCPHSAPGCTSTPRNNNAIMLSASECLSLSSRQRPG